jgi:hypothetical protein
MGSLRVPWAQFHSPSVNLIPNFQVSHGPSQPLVFEIASNQFIHGYHAYALARYEGCEKSLWGSLFMKKTVLEKKVWHGAPHDWPMSGVKLAEDPIDVTTSGRGHAATMPLLHNDWLRIMQRQEVMGLLRWSRENFPNSCSTCINTGSSSAQVKAKQTLGFKDTKQTKTQSTLSTQLHLKCLAHPPSPTPPSPPSALRSARTTSPWILFATPASSATTLIAIAATHRTTKFFTTATSSRTLSSRCAKDLNMAELSLAQASVALTPAQPISLSTTPNWATFITTIAT